MLDEQRSSARTLSQLLSVETQIVAELRQMKTLASKPASRLVAAAEKTPSKVSEHPDPSPFHKDTVIWDSAGSGFRCRLCSNGDDFKWAAEGHYAGREHQKKLREAGY